MISNQNKEIAVTYFQTIPHVVRVGTIDYVFVVQHAICMAWVRPEHVQRITDIVKECCGGNKQKVYHLANDAQVRIWTGAAER